MGAGLPAKQARPWMAPAVPVFAGKPAPTEYAPGLRLGCLSPTTDRQLHRPPGLPPGQPGDPRPRW
ncbi:hypothetical protein D0O09_00610 [Pseudomonas putida]|nr:hypothetical protein D0O09_00610 [Pseudomonas putida]